MSPIEKRRGVPMVLNKIEKCTVLLGIFEPEYVSCLATEMAMQNFNILTDKSDQIRAAGAVKSGTKPPWLFLAAEEMPIAGKTRDVLLKLRPPHLARDQVRRLIGLRT